MSIISPALRVAEVHGAHLRAVEGGDVLQQPAENLRRDVERDEIAQDLLLARLVFVDGRGAGARALRLGGRNLRRDELQRDRLLLDHRLELREVERRHVEPARLVKGEQLLRDVVGMREGDLADAAQIDAIDVMGAELAPHGFGALAAHHDHLHRLALGKQMLSVAARQLRDVGVEAAGQTALAGHDDQEMHLVAARPDEQRRSALVGDARAEARHHLIHAVGVGTRGGRHLLRAAQLRRGDHLHRLGDLARRLHRGDAVSEVF